MGCAADGPGRVISGIWTRCSSRSTVSGGTCGVRSTRTASCWTSWSPLGRDATAATRFFRKLLTELRCAAGAGHRQAGQLRWAQRRLMRSVEHRRSKYLNNRAENSHQSIRQRERAMKKFTSPGHAQRFLSAFSGISPHFRSRRHRLTAAEYATRRPHASPPGTRSPDWPQQPPDHSATATHPDPRLRPPAVGESHVV